MNMSRAVRSFLASIAIAVALSAACRTTHRQAPATTPATQAPQDSSVRLKADTTTQPEPAPVVEHRRWRPLHKGGGYLSTGVYIREDDDLVIDTPMPIVLRRTYNSGDGHARQFGMDTTHSGEWWLYGDGNPSIPWAEVILANGGRMRFTRISPGNTMAGAILRHDSTPTEFGGALLSWTPPLWDVRFRDGSLASFHACITRNSKCSLLERRDPDGHLITYVRDDEGTLQRMESDGQNISFQYDDQKRIVRAYDTQWREVRYSYDDRGRLIRASGSDGIVRTYEYDDRNNLTAVREPGRIVLNWFDAEDRWVRQVVKDSEDDDDPYIATARYVVEGGSIVESAFDEGDGLRVDRYNSRHYIVSETLDADGSSPIVFNYARDPVSNALTGMTMTCAGRSGPTTITVPNPSDSHQSRRTDRFVQDSCLPRVR